MDWNSYEIYHPGVFGPLRTLPRADARRAFDRLMSQKAVRIAMLRRLLKANGTELSSTDDGIQALNDWFLAHVEPAPEKPGWLLTDWYSVVNDVGLFLGKVLIERCPGLRWDFCTWGGKRNLDYQRAVVTGFDRLPHPKMDYDFDRMVAGYAHHVIANRGSVRRHGTVAVRGVELDLDEIMERHRHDPIQEDAFLRWIKMAESLWRGELPDYAQRVLRQRRAGKEGV